VTDSAECWQCSAETRLRTVTMSEPRQPGPVRWRVTAAEPGQEDFAAITCDAHLPFVCEFITNQGFTAQVQKMEGAE